MRSLHLNCFPTFGTLPEAFRPKSLHPQQIALSSLDLYVTCSIHHSETDIYLPLESSEPPLRRCGRTKQRSASQPGERAKQDQNLGLNARDFGCELGLQDGRVLFFHRGFRSCSEMQGSAQNAGRNFVRACFQILRSFICPTNT